jgi:hypothetical protein
MDLLAELRLQIYGYLLPDIPPSQMRPGSPLRRDGGIVSTASMTICKQIQNESAGVLYGSRQFELKLNSRYVAFVNQEAQLKNMHTVTGFLALRQVEKLCIKVYTQDAVTDACAV